MVTLLLRREPFGGNPSKASPERGGAREAGGGVRSPRRIGRGGSVSRRDLNPKTEKRAHATWARKSEGTHKPIPSYSSGGSAREGLLLEKPQTVDKVVNGLFKWKKARKRQSNVE